MPTVAKLALRYVAERRNRGEFCDDSARVVRGTLADFCRHCPDNPERVTRRHVERWLERPDWKPAYRRTRLSYLRNFLRWCVLNGHMRRDPSLAVKAPRQPKYPPRSLTSDASHAVATACHDRRTLLVVLLMLQEGLRRGEVSRARREDVDHRRRSLAVRGKGGHGEVTRHVPLSEETWQALTGYLRDIPDTTGPLIRSVVRPWAGVRPQRISEMAAGVMYEAGVKHKPWDGVSAHALRHTSAQDLVDQGADIRAVQALLGHESVKTTEIYARNRVDLLRSQLPQRQYNGHEP